MYTTRLSASQERIRIRRSGGFWLVEFNPENTRRWIRAGRHSSRIKAQADLRACFG